MSGPGDAISIWEAITRKNAANASDVQKDWTALCAAWTQFHATMERHLAATGAGQSVPAPAPPPPAPPAPAAGPPSVPGVWPMMPPLSPSPLNPAPAAPGIPQAAPRMTPQAPPPPPAPNATPGQSDETQLAVREKFILDSIQSISNTMTAEVTRISSLYMSGRMAANQVNQYLSIQYNFALGAFQLLRVEAAALDRSNHKEALRVLDLFVDDTQKALGIVGNMVSQQQAFQMGISKIWQTTMTDITSTQLALNSATRLAFDKANEKYFSKF